MNLQKGNKRAPKIALQIPILTEKDMCKGGLHGANNTSCLLGHVFCLNAKVGYNVGKLMEETMQRMLRRRGFYSLPEFNDLNKTTLAAAADFWNQARRRVIQNAWRKRA